MRGDEQGLKKGQKREKKLHVPNLVMVKNDGGLSNLRVLSPTCTCCTHRLAEQSKPEPTKSSSTAINTSGVIHICLFWKLGTELGITRGHQMRVLIWLYILLGSTEPSLGPFIDPFTTQRHAHVLATRVVSSSFHSD